MAVRGFKKRLEPFGATKKRGKQYERERKFQNRIHALEQEVAALKRAEAHAISRACDAERLRDLAQPSASQHAALKAFANLPMETLVEIRMNDHALVLATWSLEIQGKRLAAPESETLGARMKRFARAAQ